MSNFNNTRDNDMQGQGYAPAGPQLSTGNVPGSYEGYGVQGGAQYNQGPDTGFGVQGGPEDNSNTNQGPGGLGNDNLGGAAGNESNTAGANVDTAHPHLDKLRGKVMQMSSDPDKKREGQMKQDAANQQLGKQ